jgi:hypothetical protein
MLGDRRIGHESSDLPLGDFAIGENLLVEGPAHPCAAEVVTVMVRRLAVRRRREAGGAEIDWRVRLTCPGRWG